MRFGLDWAAGVAPTPGKRTGARRCKPAQEFYRNRPQSPPRRSKTMGLTVINGPFIQAGESLSDGVDCSGGDAVRITMPGAWSGGNLTFQISTDGALYNDLFTARGQRGDDGGRSWRRGAHQRRVGAVLEFHQVQIRDARASGRAEGAAGIRGDADMPDAAATEAARRAARGAAEAR